MEHPSVGKAQLLEDFKARWDSAQETIEYSGAFTGKSNDQAMLELKVEVFLPAEAIYESTKPKMDALLEQQRAARRTEEETKATQFQIKTEINKVRQRQREVQERLRGTASSLPRARLAARRHAASPDAIAALFPPSTLKLDNVAFEPKTAAILADMEKAPTLAELEAAPREGARRSRKHGTSLPATSTSATRKPGNTPPISR